MNYIDELATRIAEIADYHPFDKKSAPLFRMYAVLALSLGNNVTREVVHNAWSAWCAAVNPDHPSLLPFSELSPVTQAKDEPYVVAIKLAFDELTRQP